MKLQPLYITGTDTGVGKTILTTALVAYGQAHRWPRRLGVFKPLQSGEGDREHYQTLPDLDQTLEQITPLYFQAPLAPPIAAEREGRSIDLALVWQRLQALRQERDWVLVEALGGLGSPVTWELTVADLAAAWRLPTVLVVPVRLGAIGQAVANAALARQVGVPLRGIVLNCLQPCSSQEQADWAPIDLIQSLTRVPVLGILPYLPDLQDWRQLSRSAAQLDLERLMPEIQQGYGLVRGCGDADLGAAAG